MVLGDNIEATKLFNETPHFWRNKGLVPGMLDLVGAEIAAHPEDVSSPISILVVDKDGPRWLPGFRGLCPALQSTSH